MTDFPDSTPVTEISRQIVEAEIDLLIDLLDKFDEDPDIETDGDDEPSIGAPNQQAGSWSGIVCEGHDDHEADPSDDEPELGWTAVQARTGRYGWDDSNAYEPSLGSTNSFNQSHWWRGRMDESEYEHDGREDCCEDEGAQCDDEGAVEEDNGSAEDDFTSLSYVSREDSDATKKITQALIDGLRGRVKPHEPGLVVYSSTGLRGVVTRIY